MRAIRQHWKPVAVILFAIVLSLAVAGFILDKQRLPLPWDDTYEVNAQFTSAQAVTPGQGQAVAVAGVQVGEIKSARIEDGRAVVGLRIDRKKLDAVHRGATVMLRPRTGLQDMTIELDPGKRSAPKLREGATISAQQSTSQVQVDEVLASLDADTRAYFQQLLQATDRGFTNNAEAFRRVLDIAAPTATETHEVLSVLTERRQALSSVVTRLGRLSQAIGQHDRAVGATLDRASTTLRTLAGRDRELKQSLAQLPSTLRLTQDAVTKTGDLMDEVVPASKALRPALKDVTAALPKLDPLLKELPGRLTPLRTLATEGREPLRQTRATIETIEPLLGDLSDSAKVLQHVVNVLGYDPPGDEKGFSYYLAWFGHNTNSVFSTQDANGAAWRGQLLLSCSSLGGVDALQSVTQLLTGLGVCR
ncbi:MlaD family protein [Patulibacter sp. S7RM1-6]